MLKKKLLNIFVAPAMGISSCLLSQCNVINPAEPVPAYLHIDSVQLTTNYTTQGSNSHHTPDIWVYLDNNYLGTYEMPVTFPIIGEGNHLISLKAGIIENGISETRSAYSAFHSFDTMLFLSPKNISRFNPPVSYYASATFPQLEDFDDASLNVAPSGGSVALLNITANGDPNAYEGNSGEVVLDDNHTLFEVSSSAGFSLPISIPVYIELNYKCDREFEIGRYVNSSLGVEKGSLLRLRVTNTWKKVYVNMSTLGGVVQGGSNYKVYLRAEKAIDGTTGNLYFDNLKVVY